LALPVIGVADILDRPSVIFNSMRWTTPASGWLGGKNISGTKYTKRTLRIEMFK
jgi:hypothetical protein